MEVSLMQQQFVIETKPLSAADQTSVSMFQLNLSKAFWYTKNMGDKLQGPFKGKDFYMKQVYNNNNQRCQGKTKQKDKPGSTTKEADED